MGIELLTPPALEPVTLAEAKLHLRVDHTDEDALIQSLIVTSRLQIEAALGIALLEQSWRIVRDAWPLSDVVDLPLHPVRVVTAVSILDAAGAAQVLDPIGYVLEAAARPPRLVTRSGYWPAPGARAGGIQIDVEAGYGPTANDVPAPLRQAVLMLAAH